MDIIAQLKRSDRLHAAVARYHTARAAHRAANDPRADHVAADAARTHRELHAAEHALIEVVGESAPDGLVFTVGINRQASIRSATIGVVRRVQIDELADTLASEVADEPR